MALLEEAVVDLISGAFVNCDLAGYLVPVHADIPVIDAVISTDSTTRPVCLASKGSVSSASAAREPPSEMRYSTRPQCACGISQSPWTSCCPPCHSKSDADLLRTSGDAAILSVGQDSGPLRRREM